MSTSEVSSIISVEDLLVMWGLTSFSQNFTDEGLVDLDESFCALVKPEHKDIVKPLIPMTGPRLKFERNLTELVSQAKSDKPASKCNESSTSTLKESLPLLPTGQLECNSDETLAPKKRYSASNTGTAAKKRCQPAESDHKNNNHYISETDKLCEKLKTLLESTGSGRCLFALGKKNKRLKEKDRLRLSEIIIEDFLGKDDKVTADHFNHISQAITQIFVGEEQETYYIPYKKVGNAKCLAKGKLVSKYYSLRRELKSVGLLSAHEDDAEVLDNAGVSNSTDDIDHGMVQGMLKYMEANTEPWETIVGNWSATFPFRIREIQSKNGGTVAEYFNKYPALKEKLGYTLLTADFEVMYPGLEFTIYTEWDSFAKKAVNAFKEHNPKTVVLSDTLELLDNDELTEEAKALTILLALGQLDTVVTVARGKQKQPKVTKSWRPPHSEIQEGLISHIDSVSKLDEFVKDRRDKLYNWGQKVQPYVVVCGANVEEIDASYVVVDTVYYMIASPLRALDTCFKLIHAVHADYSPESVRLWMLIQLKVYGMLTECDKKDPELPSLLQKFSS